MAKTKLQSFIADEVDKVKGICVPVHASRLERALVRKVNCNKLHPNPDDEFCFPEIGPNESIISNYEKDYRRAGSDRTSARMIGSGIAEPLDVQKIHPSGYMILNGHHRWIAAIRTGMSRLPVRIVNLTQEKEIRKMLELSKHDKRITLDLEEVAFVTGKDEKMEKSLSFPLNRIYFDRLRLGIPSLFAYLTGRGYDIWLYSSGYESVDYVRELLKLYHTHVTGIITGTARKAPKDVKTLKELEALMASKYSYTIHADKSLLLCVNSRTKEYREYPLSGDAAWSAEIIDIIGAMEKNA